MPGAFPRRRIGPKCVALIGGIEDQRDQKVFPARRLFQVVQFINDGLENNQRADRIGVKGIHNLLTERVITAGDPVQSPRLMQPYWREFVKAVEVGGIQLLFPTGPAVWTGDNCSVGTFCFFFPEKCIRFNLGPTIGTIHLVKTADIGFHPIVTFWFDSEVLQSSHQLFFLRCAGQHTDQEGVNRVVGSHQHRITGFDQFNGHQGIETEWFEDQVTIVQVLLCPRADHPGRDGRCEPSQG